MDTTGLGAIGELVGGVAVIGSLLYVGLQIRQSNRQSRLDAARDVQNQFDRWPEWIIGNDAAREAWAVATGWGPAFDLENPADLSDTELTYFHVLIYRAANAFHHQCGSALGKPRISE